MDEGSERGISGALALWGPLIIIGFLVLVLNTQETPQTPDTGEAAEAAAATGSLAPAEALPASTEAEPAAALEAAELAAVESPPATEAAAQASEESVPQASASGEAALETVPEAPAASSSEPEAVAVTGVPTESGDGAPGVSAALEEPVAQAGEDAEVSEDLDLGAVLEAARSVISQEVGDALAEAISDADAPPVPAAPEASAATLALPEAPPAPPLPAAPGAAGIAASPWGASQPGGQGEAPIWSSGANPWAVTSSSPDEPAWGEGAGTTAGPATDPDWPPPPAESVAAMAPPPSGAPMFPGAGYWPRPPVLVPCAPPYYWCIALPAPMYHSAPGVGYP